MEQITKLLDSVNIDIGNFDVELFMKAALILCVGSLLLGLIGRFIFGKRSTLNHTISSAIGILFVYAATVVLYTAGAEFQAWIAPLPFINIAGENLSIFSFKGAEYTVICEQVLSMIILAFLANLIDAGIPKGKNLFTWLFFRCVTVVLAMALHLLVNYLFTTFLPEGIVTYAPTVLLFLLVILLAVGALKFVVGAVLATVNPVIAAFYTFFFASVVGKQLTKAVFTTAILSALVWLLNEIGCTVISVATAALVAYIPLLIVLLIIWYVVNRVL